MFNTYMRTNVVKGTIDEYCLFLRNFSVPDEDDPNIWSINDYPLLEINLTVNKDYMTNLEKNERKKLETLKDDIPLEHLDKIPYFDPGYDQVV